MRRTGVVVPRAVPWAVALVLACALAAGACHRIRIVNGAGGGVPSPAYYERWHHNIIVGAVEISGPVDLAMVCPGGNWTEIQVRRSVLNTIIWLIPVVNLIWQPQTVTILCSTGYAVDGVMDASSGDIYTVRRADPSAK
jgi:hypothetical protein